MKKLKFTKPKKVSLTKLKKRAWAQFSKYIRLKYADKNGMECCYTCGKKAHWKQMQAGHGIGGRNNSVLFMEEVVRPQCAGCNLWGGGKYSIFAEKLISEYGPIAYAKFVKKSNETVVYKAYNYEAIYEAYKDLVKELEGGI